MGLETEYAFTPFGHNDRVLNRMHYSQRLVSLAARHYPSLFGRDKHDLFLGNGGRLYVDSGCGLLNTEYSTPECTSPEELIAHIRAGDRLLANLARELESEKRELKTAFISKCNFDYSGHTSGSHENYLHTVPQKQIAGQIIPHLVSRIVYTGGGGFDDNAPNVEFMLSPRVGFLEHDISRGAQDNRAIFTLKNDSLSDSRYGRLHLLCGEGVRYDLSEYLRFGVTSLIVRLIDAGMVFAEAIELDPLRAMNIVARDIDCNATIGLIDDVEATAIDVQRHYLRQVQVHVGGPYLPDWANTVCSRWEATLDRLEANPRHLIGKIDWVTKLAFYRSFVARKGLDWRRLTEETHDSQRQIRMELFELDVCFGDISEAGPFAILENIDHTDKVLVTGTEVNDALRIPPQGTRAKIRGEWVERLSHRRRRKRCNWNRIRDYDARQTLYLDDPFGTSSAGWERSARCFESRDSIRVRSA